MNGYQYHAHFVVAVLGAVNIILGMNFLNNYGAIIDLKTDQVSPGSETFINAVQDTIICPDSTRVRLKLGCIVKTGD